MNARNKSNSEIEKAKNTVLNRSTLFQNAVILLFSMISPFIHTTAYRNVTACSFSLLLYTEATC